MTIERFCIIGLLLVYFEVTAVHAHGDLDAGLIYKVRIDTTALSGHPAEIEFHLLSSSEGGAYIDRDQVAVSEYFYDASPAHHKDNPPGSEFWGAFDIKESLRGWAYPDFQLLTGDEILSMAQFDYDSLGTFISFHVRMSNRADEAAHPSTFSLYLFRLVAREPDGYLLNGGSLAVTEDPLGTDALFSLIGEDRPSGTLEVYAPVRFVPPDPILLDLATCRGVEDR